MNILLVDDHKMMRDGLRSVLEHEPGLHVAGEAADGRGAIDACNTLHPDIVIMDIAMRGLNGIDATRQITARNPRVRVIALSMNTDRRFVQAMFEAGAWAYVVKSSAADELLRALRAVGRDEKFVSPAVTGAVVDVLTGVTVGQDRRAQLSPREREVLQLIAEGLTSKEIAARLDVAVSTVETHRKQLMGKLDLRSIAELTKFAIREGLTGLD